MSEPMKKLPTSNLGHGKNIYCLSEQGRIFRIPVRVAGKYLVTKKSLEQKAKNAIQKSQMTYSKNSVDAAVFSQKLDAKYTQAGALLRGTRHREGLAQKEFAKKIGITQGDLSKMENGKRSIGKIVAKRIQKMFGVNYRYFLE